MAQARPPSDRARRDACPGALQTHPAADGAVARIRIPGGILTARQLRELGATATSFGSGIIELTSRANVQVRGLGVAAEAGFASRMAAAGLLPSATHERVRNILASPMAGIDGHGLIEVAPLVRELDHMLRARPALSELPGRFLFALDDGRGDVTRLGADITLLPIPAADPRTPGGTVEGALLPAGADVGLRAGLARAVPAMVAAAEAFLAERAAQGSTAWRVAELDDGPSRIAARVRAEGKARLASLGEAPAASPRPPAAGSAAVRPGAVDVPARPPLGLVPGSGERVALVVMPPLGRLTAAQAHAVADAAEAADGEIRLTPWRGVIVPGMSRDDAGMWLSRLAGVGLVTDPGSPWTGVTACTGRPGCAKSLADVRADAARSVALTGLAVPPALPLPPSALPLAAAPGPLPVHWAGCERRCGRPAGRAVVVVATGDGYRVDEDGR